jgi:small subunit ribosomal protein S10
MNNIVQKKLYIIYIFFKSFDNNILNISINNFYNKLLKLNIKKIQIINLASKKIEYCVIRSPHVDKNSREQFAVTIFKSVIILTVTSLDILNDLLEIKVHFNVYYKLKLLQLKNI